MCNLGELIEELMADYESVINYSSQKTKKETLEHMEEKINLIERGIRRWIMELKKD